MTRSREDSEQELKGGRFEHLLADAVLLQQVIIKKPLDLELSTTKAALEDIRESSVLFLEVTLSVGPGGEALGASEASNPAIRFNGESRNLYRLGLQVSRLRIKTSKVTEAYRVSKLKNPTKLPQDKFRLLKKW